MGIYRNDEFDSLSTDDLSVTNVGVHAYNSPNSNQSVSSGTETKVALHETEFDDENEADLSNNRITVADGGVYLIIGQALWDEAIADGTRMITKVKVNGTIKLQSNNIIGGSGYVSWPTMGHLQLTAGDNVELFVEHYSGSAVNLNPGTKDTFIEVIQLG